MANVLFKRGLQAGLPVIGTGGSVVDGALYFTTDTKRLFLGNNTELLPIAEGITTVTAVNDLPTASAQNEGMFYYVNGDNILAYSDGTKWLQVNMSDAIDTMSHAATQTGSDALVTLSSTRKSHVAGPTASFKVVAGDNVTVTASGNEIQISVPSASNDTLYTLSTAAGSSAETGYTTVAINLTPDVGTGTGTVSSAVTISKSDTINVLRDANGVLSFAVNEQAISGIQAFTATATTTGFNHVITKNDNSPLTTNIDPIVSYGVDTNSKLSAHFVNGTASLSIYTASEIDDMLTTNLQQLNSMTYRGAVDEMSDLTNATDKKLGDTWVATETFIIPAGSATGTSSSVDVAPGYIIIANSSATPPEVNGVIPANAVTYDVISGDTKDTNYKFNGTTGGVQLQEKVGSTWNTIGALTISTSSALTVSGADTGTNAVVTLDLSTVTQSANSTTSWAQTVGDESTITVVTGVSVDAQGRTYGIQTTTMTLVDSVASGNLTQTVTSSNNVATISHGLMVSQTAAGTVTFNIASAGNSIAITTSGDTVNMDLVWGSF